MCFSNVVDQFLDEHCLSDSCTSKQSNFSSSCIWGKKIDDFNTSDENFSSTTLIYKTWCFSVNWISNFGFDGSSLIDWITNHIHNTTQCFWADWDSNGTTQICDWLTSNQTFCGIHGNSSDSAISQVLCDFQDQFIACALDLKCIQNWWKWSIKLYIYDCTNDLSNLPSCFSCSCCSCFCLLLSSRES